MSTTEKEANDKILEFVLLWQEFSSKWRGKNGFETSNNLEVTFSEFEINNIFCKYASNFLDVGLDC